MMNLFVGFISMTLQAFIAKEKIELKELCRLFWAMFIIVFLLPSSLFFVDWPKNSLCSVVTCEPYSCYVIVQLFFLII